MDPLDEANGFAKLMDAKVMGDAVLKAETIADQIGVSKQYVYQRISLLKLSDDASSTLRDGKLNVEQAALIATLRADDQPKALKFVREYHPSVKRFRDFVSEEIKFAGARDLVNAAIAGVRAKDKKARIEYISSTHRHDHAARHYPKQTLYLLDHGYKLAGKTKTCPHQAHGVYVDVKKAGEVTAVCIEPGKCKIHNPPRPTPKPEKKHTAKAATPKQKAAAAREKAKREAAAEQAVLDEQVDEVLPSRIIIALIEACGKSPKLDRNEIAALAEVLFDISTYDDQAADALIQHFGLTPASYPPGQIVKAIENAKSNEQAVLWLIGVIALTSQDSYHSLEQLYQKTLKARGVDVKQIERDTLAEIKAQLQREKDATGTVQTSGQKTPTKTKAKKAKAAK